MDLDPGLLLLRLFVWLTNKCQLMYNGKLVYHDVNTESEPSLNDWVLFYFNYLIVVDLWNEKFEPWTFLLETLRILALGCNDWIIFCLKTGILWTFTFDISYIGPILRGEESNNNKVRAPRLGFLISLRFINYKIFLFILSFCFFFDRALLKKKKTNFDRAAPPICQ